MKSELLNSQCVNRPPARFRPGHLWRDTKGNGINAHGGGILFHNGLYWWYGEHKMPGRGGNLAQVGVRVYCSGDLLLWEDKGIALAVSDDAGSDIARECILERPKVIFHPGNGTFVMWFHLERRGNGYASALSGVAVSDTPEGPFRYLTCFRPNKRVWPLNIAQEAKVPLSDAEQRLLVQKEFDGASCQSLPEYFLLRRDFATGQMARDMTLFVDDDGAAYHIYSSEENGTLHVSLLSDDWLAPAGHYARVLPGRFHEAPAIIKHGERYFLFTSGCTGWTPNAARLSMAESIMGPWVELGNPCRGTAEEVATTFHSQSTFILPVASRRGAFIFMADRWAPSNPIDGRYVWLPLQFVKGIPQIVWRNEWSLEVFDSPV